MKRAALLAVAFVAGAVTSARLSRPAVDAAIEAAEQRGYLRGSGKALEAMLDAQFALRRSEQRRWWFRSRSRPADSGPKKSSDSGPESRPQGRP